MAPGTPGPELRGLRSAPGCALRQAGLRGARGDGGCDPAVPGLPEGLRPRPFLLPPWAACCRGEKAEAARKKLSVPLPGSAPSANRTPCRILSSADNTPRCRPRLGTERCHGGDDGLCLAGCESIRCAGSTAAE
ncbi:uncharacterized protein LOC113460175 isoform X2 [Zonotrichia albicollis]|uniref:uncharacterized protein LOC113460175 isoform X2 n=1 Tax=Zonotrichia albicollis TaxID=44394 RepID=UPI003D80C3D5